MSSIEERLARDIAAVTGGVVVTESDLKSARDEVGHRVDDERLRGRRRTVAAAIVAAVVIPIVGVVAVQTLGDDEAVPPANPGPSSPNPDDAFLTGSAVTAPLLQGLWRLDNGTAHYRFLADGSVSMDETGQVVQGPAVTGTYQVEDGEVTVTIAESPAGCAGETLTLHASLPEPGLLNFIHNGSGTDACLLAPAERGTLEQLLPATIYDDSEWPPDADATPLTRGADLHGLWVALGRGDYVLEMSPRGSYSLLDGSGEVVDQGEWTLGGSELTLTSSAASSTCARGDTLAWSGLEVADPGTAHVRGTVVEDTCAAPWAAVEGWFLVPHDGS